MGSIAVSKVFSDAVTRLASAAEGLAESVRTGEPKWVAMKDEDKMLDGFDPKDFADTFNRDELNKTYLDALNPESEQTYRITQAAKVQSDFVAAVERDLRMRSRSRVRQMGHAAARLKTHGLAEGPLQGCALQMVRLLIQPE